MSKKEKDTLHIYTRVSTIGQSLKGMSLGEQKNRGIEVSKRLEMDYKIWNEGGKSSYEDTLINRTVLLRMIDGWKDGSIKNIYVTDFDRLSRKDTSWYIILRDIRLYNIKVYVGEGTLYDVTSYVDKLMLTVMSGVTQYDNEQRTQRFQRNKIRKFNEGYYIHGTTVFGYEKYTVGKGKKLREHSEGNGKIVKKIYSMFSKGKTIKDIQLWLVKEKIKSPRNNFEWGQQQLINLLQNKTYIGEVTYTDKKSDTVYKNKCKRLIGDKVWFEVQKRFTDYYEETRQKNRQKHDYLLTSILYCGVCGYRMRGLRNKKTYRNIYYCGTKEEGWRNFIWKDGCNRNKSKSVNIDRLDDLVWNEMIETIKESKVLREMEKKSIIKVEGNRGEQLVKKQLSDKKIEKLELEKERIQHQQKRTKIYELWINGGMEEKEMNSLVGLVDKNIWEVNGKLEDLEIYVSRLYENKKWVDWFKIYMDDVKKWEQLTDVNKKKELLKTYMERVDVSYDGDDGLHKVEIYLRLHLFNDKYIITKDYERDELGRIKKGKEYKIEEGSKSKVMYMDKTKVGRKKKDYLVKK